VGRHTEDLNGRTFGVLTVLGRENGPRIYDQARWICLCSCGLLTIVSSSNLRRGITRSCGCLRANKLRARRLRHGLTESPTYSTWLSMRSRCNPNNVGTHAAKWYADRNVTVCDRWALFENFLADMGERPEGMTIDRIDTDGNYEPGNCRWATLQEQVRNRKATRFIEYNGEARTASEWGALLGLRPGTLRARLDHGWSVERALEPPTVR